MVCNDTNHPRPSSGRENPPEPTKGQQKLYPFYASSLEAGDGVNHRHDAENHSSVRRREDHPEVRPRGRVDSLGLSIPRPHRVEPVTSGLERPSITVGKGRPCNRNGTRWRAERGALGGAAGVHPVRRSSGWTRSILSGIPVFFPRQLQFHSDPKAQPPPPPPTYIPRNKTLIINMTIEDILALTKTSTPIHDLSPIGDELSCTSDVVFLRKKLLTSFVTASDQNGKPVEQSAADVTRYK